MDTCSYAGPDLSEYLGPCGCGFQNHSTILVHSTVYTIPVYAVCTVLKESDLNVANVHDTWHCHPGPGCAARRGIELGSEAAEPTDHNSDSRSQPSSPPQSEVAASRLPESLGSPEPRCCVDLLCLEKPGHVLWRGAWSECPTCAATARSTSSSFANPPAGQLQWTCTCARAPVPQL